MKAKAAARSKQDLEDERAAGKDRAKKEKARVTERRKQDLEDGRATGKERVKSAVAQERNWSARVLGRCELTIAWNVLLHQFWIIVFFSYFFFQLLSHRHFHSVKINLQ